MHFSENNCKHCFILINDNHLFMDYPTGHNPGKNIPGYLAVTNDWMTSVDKGMAKNVNNGTTMEIDDIIAIEFDNENDDRRQRYDIIS